MTRRSKKCGFSASLDPSRGRPASADLRSLRTAALWACLLTALPALAFTPAAGTYIGQTTQGFTMRVVVSVAPDGVSNEVTSVDTLYLMRCELPDPNEIGMPVTIASRWPIDTAGNFGFSALFTNQYARTTGTFLPDGSVAGVTEYSIAAVTRKAPHTAEVCASSALPWTATFAGPIGSAR
jgi:hypothetical protein